MPAWMFGTLALVVPVCILLFFFFKIRPIIFSEPFRDIEAAREAFVSYDWTRLKREFEKSGYAPVDQDRLERAFEVYKRLMIIAYEINILRPKTDPIVRRIAPFDKDVDSCWRLHTKLSDYDSLCERAFGGVMRPRDDRYEDPSWETREERQQTKIRYKKKYHLALSEADTGDDFIPPVIVV